MTGSKEPSEGVLASQGNALPVTTLVVLRHATGVDVLAVLSHLGLLGGHKVRAGGGGEVGDEPERGEAHDQADGALEQQEPPPGGQATEPAHVLQHGGGEQARDDVGDDVAGVPDAHAQGRLGLCVPRRGQEGHGGDEGALGHADEEAAQHKGPGRVDGGHADGDGGPGQHEEGEQPAGLALGHDDVGGNLRDDVADVEHGDAGGPLHVRHVAVFLHPAQPGVADVDPVEVAVFRRVGWSVNVAKSSCVKPRAVDWRRERGIGQNLLHQQHASHHGQKLPVQLANQRLLNGLELLIGLVLDQDILLHERVPAIGNLFNLDSVGLGDARGFSRQASHGGRGVGGF